MTLSAWSIESIQSASDIPGGLVEADIAASTMSPAVDEKIVCGWTPRNSVASQNFGVQGHGCGYNPLPRAIPDWNAIDHIHNQTSEVTTGQEAMESEVKNLVVRLKHLIYTHDA